MDIWKFVIGRVHSAQTVKKVQGNLALKNRQTSSLAYKVIIWNSLKCIDCVHIRIWSHGLG